MSTESLVSAHNIVGGIDVGNGYVKGIMSGIVNDVEMIDIVDIPSVVVSTSRSTPKVPVSDTHAIDVVSDDDFYNHLMVACDSPVVDRSDLRIFGRSALKTPGSKVTQFDIASSKSKAEQELSFVLVLGVFAGKALRDYVREHQSLPTHELRVTAQAGLALPITEYVHHRVPYAARFVGQVASAEPTTHLVTIKNFATPIVVRIQFTDIQVLPEGASAQLAIRDKGVGLAQALLDDLRSSADAGGVTLDGITAEMLVAARTTIGVDVGEGTTNVPVFTDGQFNAEASGTLDRGYGTALAHALDHMRGDADLRFSTRKALADFLTRTPSALVADRYARAHDFVMTEAEYLAEEIGVFVDGVLAAAGDDAEVIYVYGGGSGPMKEVLRPVIQRVAGSIPVLYLDASFSRHLNREGLYLAAQTAASLIQASQEGTLW